MPNVHVRAKVKLEESIILATQDDWSYPELSWSTRDGDKATVSLVVDDAEIRRVYSELEAGLPWWVNSRVDNLRVEIEFQNVPDDTIDRLLGRHPTAERFIGDGREYQEAKEFGRRVVDGIVLAANEVLAHIKADGGQFWLRPVDAGDSLQNFLSDVEARWRLSETDDWKALFVAPHTAIMLRNAVLGAADQYLQIADWREIGRRLLAGEGRSTAFTLVAQAKEAFAREERQLAFVHLNSALEWAVQAFLEEHYVKNLPAESLKVVLSQSHARMLSDWVCPLIRKLEIPVAQDTWDNVQKIRKLRAEAGHPTTSPNLANLTWREFTALTKAASTFVAQILRLPRPKAPPPLEVAIAAGTVR